MNEAVFVVAFGCFRLSVTLAPHSVALFEALFVALFEMSVCPMIIIIYILLLVVLPPPTAPSSPTAESMLPTPLRRFRASFHCQQESQK